MAFTPHCASSILVFNPLDKSFEEVGHFEGQRKWFGCTALADGRVVFAPAAANGVLVAQHASWHAEVQPRRREDQVWNTTLRMWLNRAFTDAVIEAGASAGCRRRIPVHRAVLTSQGEVFERMFSGALREAGTAQVSLPEGPAVVEAVLQHLYTGELPTTVDPLLMLPLAHRLGLKECVTACAATVDHCDAATAVQVPGQGVENAGEGMLPDNAALYDCCFRL